MRNSIELKNVRVNNLKNISLEIPHNKFVVMTGVSGSGKSSLAFDTLYAEGQRRYVESLSSYARQFLGRMSKPEFDYIKGLPPAIAVEQKVNTRNPRSTVGTSTEIYDYLRMLFARIGHTFSPVSGNEVKKHTTEDVISCINSFSKGTKFIILAKLRVTQGNSPLRQLQIYLQQGFSRIYHNGETKNIEDIIGTLLLNDSLSDYYIVIDRLSVDDDNETVSRIYDSLETAFFEGEGTCRLVFFPSNLSYDFSDRFESDGIVFEEPNDNMFSFNSPTGACPVCEGFGNVIGIDEKLVILNSSLSVYDGCVQCWHGEKMESWKNEFCIHAAKDNFPIFEPYYSLSPTHKKWLWHGLPSQAGLELRDKV
ncbi:MAG: excinuclease ABC subunit A, partial [Prevotella sp.]